MELSETVEMMNSEDYQERFRAEYYQLRTRLRKLNQMIEKYKNDELDFEPVCSLHLLKKQSKIMNKYLRALVERAYIEDVHL